jgi:hypothetical protein
MTSEEPRRTVARQLRQSQAHAGLARALASFPWSLAGQRVVGHPHTAWEQLEHLRLAAEDLVSYCTDAEYRELGFPEGYWPATAAPSSEAAWQQSVSRLQSAVERMATLVEDPGRDLYARVPTAQKPDHHLLRAALILLDHDGYHTAQLVALRRALGVWPAE